MGNGNLDERLDLTAHALLLTPHGERELQGMEIAVDWSPPNPSWGTGTGGNYPGCSHGAGLLTPHGEREQERCAALTDALHHS